MKKKILLTLAVLIALLCIYVIVNLDNFKRMHHAIHLFDEDVIVENFQTMDRHFRTTDIQAPATPKRWIKENGHSLIESFQHNGKEYNTQQYLKNTRTEGLIILHKGNIIYENYMNGLKPDTKHISWSVAKSFISTLMGIAHDRGLYKLDEPVTQYLPQFNNTAYEGVKIKDILQMSSGVKFNEDYGDFWSDINRFGRTFSFGSSLEKFAKSLRREHDPGTYNHYVSIDTQVLGILLEKIMGRTITEITQTELWEPMGMEHDANWIVDNEGLALALGGLNASLRDYAKLGLMFGRDGYINGKQIVSPQWVKAATTPDAKHLLPGDNASSNNHFGYGFQWWIPQKDQGDFFAAGIYNQYVYVNPTNDVVIAKLSANHHFKTQGSVTKDIHISMFQQMAVEFPQYQFTKGLNVHY